MDKSDINNSKSNRQLTPLAELLRPETVDEVFGQDHLLAVGKPLRTAIDAGIPHSMVLWGPPGSGKTTLARIISGSLNAQVLTISAVKSGIQDIRKAVDSGSSAKSQGKATVLFVDEVHRFNKVQQDAFLPHIESGDLIFIGATTENPGFELNGALLSRLKVYVLKPLQIEDARKVLHRSLTVGSDVLPENFAISEQAQAIFVEASGGDARRVLNYIEVAAGIVGSEKDKVVSANLAAEVVGEPMARFDKRGDIYYEQISALHKSVRGSDPDASLYWFARMLAGGCDPIYIARRVVRIASEDIGNADPHALNIALNGWETYQRLGTPEGELAIAQAVIYLACCPKSNAVYKAFGKAHNDAKVFGDLEVPLHLRNAPTHLMKELGYGEEYRYAHDEPGGIAVGENYFPEGMRQMRYYQPVERGVEKRIKDYLQAIRQQQGAKSKHIG